MGSSPLTEPPPPASAAATTAPEPKEASAKGVSRQRGRMRRKLGHRSRYLVVVVSILAGFAMGTPYIFGTGSVTLSPSILAAPAGGTGCTVPPSGGWNTVVPPARTGGSMAYDSDDNYALLFGGLAPDSLTPLGDTWEYSNGCWTQECVTCSTSGSSSTTFYYSGDYQLWQVPSGVTSIGVDLRGAAGGKGGIYTGSGGEGNGGDGGRVQVTALTVTPGEDLYIFVGGEGANGTISTSQAGGFNGGGATCSSSGCDAEGTGGAGGGATTIQTSSASWTGVLVGAGGGGGGGATSCNSADCTTAEGNGGAGGGSSSEGAAGNGGDGEEAASCTTAEANEGHGGSTTGGAGGTGYVAGGTGGTGTQPTGGYGGSDGSSDEDSGGGGGGGGYEGGGGGGEGYCIGGGGGGGSSYCSASCGGTITYTSGYTSALYNGEVIITSAGSNLEPPARFNAAMAWYPNLDEFVLFGGCTEADYISSSGDTYLDNCGATTDILGDTWVWSGASGGWTQVAGSLTDANGETAWFGATAVGDPTNAQCDGSTNGCVLMYGGSDSKSDSTANGACAGTDGCLNQLWVFKGSSAPGAWITTAEAGPSGGIGFAFPQMVYIPTLPEVILYGGEYVSGGKESWTCGYSIWYSTNTWSASRFGSTCASTGVPAGISYGLGVYDTLSSSTSAEVLFMNGCLDQVCNDGSTGAEWNNYCLWAPGGSVDGAGTWTGCTGTSDSNPYPCFGPAGFYSPSQQLVIQFGGYDPDTNVADDLGIVSFN